MSAPISALRLMRIGVAAALIAAPACGNGGHDGVYVGYVEAEYVYVAAPRAGWLESLAVREGDDVASGALLFELDKDEQLAQVAEAQGRAAEAGARARDTQTGARQEEIEALTADLEAARARLIHARSEKDRWLPLVASDDASPAKGDQVVADYDAALARVKAAEDAIAVAKLAGRDAMQEAARAAETAAEAALAGAQWRLDQRSVKAETGGRVEEIYHRKGEFVAAGAPVLALLPQDHLKVRFFIPQADLSRFAPGARVSVAADGAPAPVEAIIFHVASEAEFTPPVIYSAKTRKKLVFLVEARLPAGAGLRPGLPVDVSGPAAQADAGGA